MISTQEKTFYERLTIPLVLCSYTDGRIVTHLVSDGLCAFAGTEREKIMGDFVVDLYQRVHPEDHEVVKKASADFIKDHSVFDAVYRYRRSTVDEYIIIHAVARWQPMEDGSEMILICYNDMQNTKNGIDNLYKSVQEQTEDILFKDLVTGLPNMTALWQLANERIQYLRLCEKDPAVVYFNVIAMHSYNTHYGYEKGNELIRLIGQIIDSEFKDSLLGRGPDDHFVLLYEYNGEAELIEKVNAVNAKIRKEAYGAADGVRAGVYVIESDNDAVRGLDLARQALKDIGDDMSVSCSFYSMKMNDDFWKERYIVESFEEALDKNRIKVFYQGIVDTETKEIVILEALARWLDPVRGTISPGEFIPVLSRHHLLYKLDLYMTEQVCREFKLREDAGLPLIPVSVNFSAQDFDHVDVPSKLKDIVEKYGISPNDIIVEITEQDIAQGKEEFRLHVGKLRENGHRLWIDDFGSGYSSLNVISQYKFDRIKVDMDIIHHLDDNKGVNRRILRAVMGVCREMGIHTLSEGVETKEQADYLKGIGCEMLQGYYFYKPISLDECIYRMK